MRKLDEIKARDYAADFADLDLELLRRSSADVPALVAAAEAVLAIHKQYGTRGGTYCESCVDGFGDPEPYPCDTVEAIRDALGETE